MNDNLTWIAAITIAATCWRQALAFLQRLRSFVIVKTTLNGDVSEALTAYCHRHFRRSPFGDRFVRSGTYYVRPLSRMQEVAWHKAPVQPIVFFDRWRPMLVGGMELAHNTKPTSLVENQCLILTTLRWFTDPDALLQAALDEHNRQRSAGNGGRYSVIRVHGRSRRDWNSSGGDTPTQPAAITPNDSTVHNRQFIHWTPDQIGPESPADPMKALALPAALQDTVREFIQWKDSETWFRAKQIPWRRGWLLYGGPGTGKTSLVRALAQKADMPVYSFDLSSLSNEEMSSRWRDMQQNAPCLALFEDIDGVFDRTSNILGAQSGGLTFDCLLNCLGGIETCDGVFSVITTNNIDKVAPAIGIPVNGMTSRPGRMDRAIEMPPLTPDCLERIAQRILGDWPDKIPPLVAASADCTGAQFTEKCTQTALELFWNRPAK